MLNESRGKCVVPQKLSGMMSKYHAFRSPTFSLVAAI
jgi:hypothetical protein